MAFYVAHNTARSTHITAWNTCCHNAAYHITTYFYWSVPQYCSFSKAQHALPEDGPIGPKHVGANVKIFQLYVFTFYVFNKRVHLLVKRIWMLLINVCLIVLLQLFRWPMAACWPALFYIMHLGLHLVQMCCDSCCTFFPMSGMRVFWTWNVGRPICARARVEMLLPQYLLNISL
jgi:hypothetical protein